MRKTVSVAFALGVSIMSGCSDSSDSLPVDCPATDPDNPGNRLVVIGHSNPEGSLDGNVFPEAQRWVYPSYVAERLGATYFPPELQTGIAISGVTFGDFRTTFYPEGPVPSPYHGLFDLPLVDVKARPEERHTNLAVGGARLAQALEFDDSSRTCASDDIACAPHLALHLAYHSEPYFRLVNPTGTSPSQVDIAVYLKPKWVLIHLGGNDARSLVDPIEFENNYRTMLTRLTHCNPGVEIIVANAEYNLGSAEVTTAEADELLGLVPGTSSDLYIQMQGVVPAPDDRFYLPPLAGVLAGFSVPLPRLVSAAERLDIEAHKDAYNETIRALANEFGAIYWDVDELWRDLVAEGIEVTIDDTFYQLTSDYGGGILSFEGNHSGKTAHAVLANKVINKMNEEARKKDREACQMPLVDIDAVACTDLHVRRALGLSEDPAEFTCPEIIVDWQCETDSH